MKSEPKNIREAEGNHHQFYILVAVLCGANYRREHSATAETIGSFSKKIRQVYE